MSLANNIYSTFTMMFPTQFTASDGTTFSSINDLVNHIVDNHLEDTSVTMNNKDDRWMCDQLAQNIYDSCQSAQIITADVAGGVPSGSFSSGTGTTVAWEIDKDTLANDLYRDCTISGQTDKDIADKWADDIRNAVENGSCHWDAIAGTVTPPGLSPVPLVGPGDGAFSDAVDTMATDFLVAFRTKTDRGIADGMAASILSFVNSVQVDVTGTGSLAGASGTGIVSGAS